ncbi:MAG TPA: lipoprotein [Gammaproteobacteria bacterium]|nr:lipoprotein [Gammaproteobacteria bacterium]
MRTLLVTCFALVLPVLMAGCGQKGPLYLPVTPPRTIPAMPPAATTAKPPATARSPAQVQPHNPSATTKPGA